jgi:hypothetical protein
MDCFYNVVGDENELKWFFDHCIYPLQPYESYSMVLVSRHKKLTEEEKLNFGLSRKESEFLKVETVRRPHFKDANKPDVQVSFIDFLAQVYKLNFDKRAYTTEKNLYIPEKTLSVIFYVNPCDDIKVWNSTVVELDGVKDSLIRAMLNGKQANLECKQNYQAFGNILNTIKHNKAKCKGTVYWLDYDIDVPDWWKVNTTNRYYLAMYSIFKNTFGKGNFVIISTSGGYHILVKTNSIHSNPHDVCREIDTIYQEGTLIYNEGPYVDTNGIVKYECVVNDSQIPGVPLPGTKQYNRIVTIINKEDFINNKEKNNCDK